MEKLNVACLWHCEIVYYYVDIDRMKPLSATVVLSYFIYSGLSPFYGIIREDDAVERRNDDDDDAVERRKLGVNKVRKNHSST